MASTNPPPLDLDLPALPLPNLDDLDVIINNQITLPLSAKYKCKTSPLTLTVDSRQCTKSMIRSSSRR